MECCGRGGFYTLGVTGIHTTPTVVQDVSVTSPPASLAGQALVLEGQQAELERVLLALSETAAGWYRGALHALQNGHNPERFVQAAHSLRELMKKLHVFTEVAPEGDEARMSDKFREMADAWERGRDASGCHVDGVWGGQIDEALHGALRAADKAIAWLRTNMPSFKQTSIAVFRHFDVSPRRLPSRVEAEHFDVWSKLYRFFVQVCHHDRETDDAEFADSLYALERFMLDRLKPETYREQTQLDELIQEAERGT
jgi:hypothetical protein